MTDPTIALAERQSVQINPDAKKGEGDSSSFWSLGETTRGVLLAPWGTRLRERQLRHYHRHENNWLGQSAFSGLTKRWAAAPWEIKGKRRVDYFQEVLRGADFGRGWASFLEKVGLDFLRQDAGGYIEVIAPGNPMRPPTGAINGLAYLDSLSCYPTGDPEFPVIYFDRRGGKHLMHHTRVHSLIDQPDGDERNPGYGNSALSRAISIVAQQIEMMRYVTTKLDDKPPPGIVVASNVNDGMMQQALLKYRAEMSADEPPPYGRTVWLYSTNPNFEAKLNYLAFSQAPENWSFKEYTDIHVNAIAAAVGVDVQEIWQLTGGNLGSGQQSQILHAKSQGRTFGAFLIRLERIINDLLPESLEFQFKQNDPIEEQQRAATASAWAGFAGSVASSLSPEELRQLLANTVEQYKDVVTDPDGIIRRLTDADPEEPNADEITADDDTPNGADADAQIEGDEKAWGDTRAEFVGLFTDLVRGTLDGDVNRRRAGVVLRGQLSRMGRKAYEDGLAENGVVDGLDDGDYARLLVWAAEQSRFVTHFLDELVASGLSEKQIQQRAELWADKSLEDAHRLGQVSAATNALYAWELGFADHCASCVKMMGQVHRLGTYVRKGIVPKAPVLKCTLGCKCKLVRTTGKAQGRWL